jgi:hypothetical protein
MGLAQWQVCVDRWLLGNGTSQYDLDRRQLETSPRRLGMDAGSLAPQVITIYRIKDEQVSVIALSGTLVYPEPRSFLIFWPYLVFYPAYLSILQILISTHTIFPFSY